MKILVVLTYYRPHTSGLTIYAERLSKALASRGHEVTVLTSQFEKTLPEDEEIGGVRIVRVPVLMRISKGVIMPTFGRWATKLVKQTDVIHLHLPQFDAAGVALRGRIFNKPTVITYHCDLRLPDGFFSYFVNQAVHGVNYLAAIFSHRIVTYTEDYARNSKFLSRFFNKVEIINPPVELPQVDAQKVSDFAREHNSTKAYPIIGIAARFASEKGVEILVDAMKKVVSSFPKAQVWFAGPYQNVMGEQEYFDRLSPRIKKLEVSGNWKFLGLLNPEEISAFYQNIDILTIPSLNSTEAFGLVQIEAMMNGVPSVASNLPGVRQPVKRHEMGKVVPIGDASALADALIDITREKRVYLDGDQIQQQYAPDVIATRFENLFHRIMTELKAGIKHQDD